MSEEKVINLEEKVLIKNLCDWDLYFNRIETNGSVRIPRNGQVRITRAEIQAQVYDNNIMFVGLDGQGSHARIFIDDKDTRILVGFESEDGKQKQSVLDVDAAKQLFELKTFSAFKKNVEKRVKTIAEKNFLIEEAKRQKLNDHQKIKFLEEYTGYKFDV